MELTSHIGHAEQLQQLEQALQSCEIGLQVIPLSDVAKRDRATSLLHYGNMLASKTNFENAPVEAEVAVLEQAKQPAVERDDAFLVADGLNGIGSADYIVASNRRDSDPQMLLAIFQEVLERRRVL